MLFRVGQGRGNKMEKLEDEDYPTIFKCPNCKDEFYFNSYYDSEEEEIVIKLIKDSIVIAVRTYPVQFDNTITGSFYFPNKKGE